MPVAVVNTGRFNGLDSRYSNGMATTALLARVNTVVPSAMNTTAYNDASPSADKTYDCRSAEFQGYFDADAIYPTGRTNATNTTVSTGYYMDSRNTTQWQARFCNQAFKDANPGSPLTVASTHHTNQRPIRLGYTTPATAPAVLGAKVIGDQPTTLTWNDMKHGSYLQSLLDGGMSGSTAWAEIIENANQDGDARMHIASGTWGVFDGLRVKNGHDGVGMYGTGDNTASLAEVSDMYIRNLWVESCHDDGVENDEHRRLHLFDSLIEKCYTFLSTRPSTTSGGVNANTQTVERCVIRLWPYPGPYQKQTSETGHGLLYKYQTNSPNLVMRDTILASEKFYDPGGSGPQLPVRAGDLYENVTLVWLGAGSYPGNVPTGCTLTTDASVYTNAARVWKSRHGVTDFDTVDMAKMLAPDPLL